MKEQTCCFTGHRLIPKAEIPRIKRKLRQTIIELINDGVIYYGAGGALGFDTLAAQTILDLKKEYPYINFNSLRSAEKALLLLLPFLLFLR